MRARLARALFGSGVAAVLAGASIVTGGAVSPANAAPSISQTWSVTFNDAGTPIAGSSPVVANMANGPAAVVGDRAGHVYAYYLAGTGQAVAGWPVNTGGVPVDSAPSVNGGTIYFGAGNAADPHAGGAYAVTTSGGLLWNHIEQDPSTNSYQANGESAGMAVGNLQGQVDVVAPSLGQNSDAYDATAGTQLPGFPWFQADTVFSTPAIGDVEGNNQNQIVMGGASTAGIAYGQTYTAGGHIRILRPTGNSGYAQPNQGLYCEYDTNQDVMSSPAVGQFLSGGQIGVVAGTGDEGVFASGSDTNSVIAINKYCQKQWETKLNGYTNSSPALADLFGNGGLEVVEGTYNSSGGSVYALNGATGSVIWSTPALGQVFGGPVTADLFGQGYQDVIVGTTGGVEVLDGKTGAKVATVEVGVGVQSSPLITHDPNGTIGITIAGYNGSNQGQMEHFEVSGSNGSLVSEQGAWPEFHHDPQLTGNAGTPPPTIRVPCSPPTNPPNGYYLTASDGGIFNFGNLPFCGSTGSIVLNQPVVGMAATSDGGGYWTVASDGGIFNFGDAGFYGSTGAMHLNKPVVGMAATPSGHGYWLVASDGGIFNFGDAGYYGSTGNRVLNQPIVGMAPTPSGHGYWLVASDGGIFNFGDAPYLGSTGAIHLNKPVVGMAADPATGGYWLVASDGGIFNFGAPYLGSTGAIRLNKPVVGMAADPATGGYWLVASDGGIFNFDAPFFGSTGSIQLNKPMVGGAGV